MKNLFKKLLACCLAVCMVLTLCVGAVTVSAEEIAYEGTLAIGEANVEAGATEATVSFTANAAGTGIAAAEVNVPLPAGCTSVSKVELETEDENVEVTFAIANAVEGLYVLDSEEFTSYGPDSADYEDFGAIVVTDNVFSYIIYANDAASKLNIKVNVTFAGAFNNDTEELKEIPVTATIEACKDAIDLIDLEVTPGAIKVASAHECVAVRYENVDVVEATCTTAGSYVKVGYCECGKEASRETITVEAIGHTEIDVDAVAPTCTTTGLTAGKKCSVCGVFTVPQEEVAALGHAYEAVVTAPTCTTAGYTTYTCSVCGDTYVADEVDALGHDYEGSKTYMDKETYVWYKDCDVCGESTETEAVIDTNKLISHTLIFSDVVGDTIGINHKTSTGLINKGYADYYVEVQYKRYGTGYVVENPISEPFYSDDFSSQNAAKTVDYFEFKAVSLTMMAEQFTVNLYLLDEEGNVIAVNSSTTSIRERALEYAQKYSNDTLLLTALVDMVNYGATLQNYFASKNPGTAIDGAALPTVGFEEFQSYATPVENLPKSFNNTEVKTKLLATTGLLFGNTILKVGATNTIFTQLKTNGYDIDKLEITASYTDYKGNLITDTVNVSALGEPTTQGSAILYSYVFSKLKLAELETPVTFLVTYNGTPEYKYEYSMGVYANKYITDAEMKPVIEAMELFGMSARDKLYGVDA